MTVQETRTMLEPDEVIARAVAFFAATGYPTTGFPTARGEGFLRLGLDMGEIVIGALPAAEGTWVRGSASRGAQVLARFLVSLPAVPEGRAVAARVARFARAA